MAKYQHIHFVVFITHCVVVTDAIGLLRKYHNLATNRHQQKQQKKIRIKRLKKTSDVFLWGFW